MKTAVLGFLRRLAGWWPRGGVLAAHVLAVLTRPLGHGIADDWLVAVFPELTPDRRRTVRQSTWESFLKGEATEAGVRRAKGPRDYPRLVPNPALSALRPPVVVASFHVGPYQALGATLSPLPGEALIVDREQFGARPDVTMVAGGDDEWQRARTFHRALGTVRAGGTVLTMLDGAHTDDYPVSTIHVPMLGRSLPLARGAFALARIGRAPIVPIVLRWRGTAMDATVGDPIAPDLGEERMAAAAAEWLERYLRRVPDEISVFVLERLRPPLRR